MYARKTLTVSACALVVLATSAFGIVMHNNVPSSEYEAHALNFPSAGWMGSTRPDGTPTWGSGVLIDPHWVLTAAHNIKLTGTSGENTGFQFGLGPNVFTDPGEIYAPNLTFVHPNFVNAAYSPDIGLLYFQNPITGVEPAVRFRGTDTIESLIHMIGHGTSGTESAGYGVYDGKERGSTNVLTSFGSPSVPSFNALATFTQPGFSRYQRLGGIGAPGDSGGGWFVDVDGEYQLMGITGFYLGSYHYGSASGALRLSLYNGWIDGVMASIPEPSMIVLLCAGAPVLLFRRRKRCFV